jgi:hypothetical protein
MRRFLVMSSLALLGLPAWAALFGNLSLEALRATPGLTIAELHTPEACPGPDPWLDPALNAWPREHGVTMSRFDWRADATEVKAAIGGGLRIVPQRIAYRDGAEVDRLCGCQEPDTVRLWLTALAAGTTRGDILRASLAEVGFDVARSLELAQADTCALHIDGAWQALLDLWNQIPDKAPDQRLTRLTRVAPEMGALAKKYPEIQARLVALRDGLDAAKDAEVPAFDDWFALNGVLGQDEVTLDWYAARRADPALAMVAEHARTGVFQLHVARDAWAEAAALIPDAATWLRKAPPRGATAQLAADGYLALMLAGRTTDGKALLKGMLGGEPEVLACPLLKIITAHPAAASKDQAVLAKHCDDAGVVSAWEAVRP